MGVFDVCAPCLWVRRGHHDGGEQLAPAQHRLARAGEKRLQRHTALSLGAEDDGLGVEGNQRRSQVRGGRRVAEVAAHGSQVAHRHRGHLAGDLGNHWIALAYFGGTGDLRQRSQGPDFEASVVLGNDFCQARDTLQVHHDFRLYLAVSHLGDKVGSPGNGIDALLVAGHDFNSGFKRFGCVVFKGLHCSSPVPSG